MKTTKASKTNARSRIIYFAIVLTYNLLLTLLVYFLRFFVRVLTMFGRPNKDNTNLFLIGDAFRFFVFVPNIVANKKRRLHSESKYFSSMVIRAMLAPDASIGKAENEYKSKRFLSRQIHNCML